MRLSVALLLSVLLAGAGSGPLAAQEIAARTPQGVAQIGAAPGENGIRLTIALAGAEPQLFDGIGEALVPLRAGNRSAQLLAIDIDRDGIDEIFVRTMQGQRGVLLVFRWDAGSNGYAPVTFTEDTGAPKPYLIVHQSQPVSVNGAIIEANHDSFEGGRKRLRVFRYRWNGAGFEQNTDH
jgi:hypothetical protein